jgi:hypothetical protein
VRALVSAVTLGPPLAVASAAEPGRGESLCRGYPAGAITRVSDCWLREVHWPRNDRALAAIPFRVALAGAASRDVTSSESPSQAWYRSTTLSLPARLAISNGYLGLGYAGENRQA